MSNDHTPLAEARRALFQKSRELTKHHEDRFRHGKSDMAAIERCRAADRALQRAAVEFTAELAKEAGAPEDIVRQILLATNVID